METFENRYLICEWIINSQNLQRQNYKHHYVFAENIVQAIKKSGIHPDFIAYVKDSERNYFSVELNTNRDYVFNLIFKPKHRTNA